MKITFDIVEILDKVLSKPLKKNPKFSLRFLQFFYSWTSFLTMWYIFFGAWFLRGAGVAYSFVTIALTLILSVAFFYESDGRGWKNFATLIILCSAPRLIFTPIYTIASVQTSSVNGTHVPDYHEAFHNLGMRGFKDLHNDITIIWFIYYYSFMLFMMSIQRVTCRKTVEKKKQKIYSENLKIEETRRTENEQTVGGPMYI